MVPGAKITVQKAQNKNENLLDFGWEEQPKNAPKKVVQQPKVVDNDAWADNDDWGFGAAPSDKAFEAARKFPIPWDVYAH